MTQATTLGRAPRPRVDWVDYSKGICIFLVVMLHANRSVQEAQGVDGWLQHVVDFARPFRMPDFFLIAGLFLANVIGRRRRAVLHWPLGRCPTAVNLQFFKKSFALHGLAEPKLARDEERQED